jgi:hypothetical protein
VVLLHVRARCAVPLRGRAGVGGWVGGGGGQPRRVRRLRRLLHKLLWAGRGRPR